MEPKLKSKYDWLRQHLQVDILNIDQEIMQQPVLFQDAIELSAQLQSDEQAASHNLSIVQAQVAAEFRAEKREKPYSESAINSMLILDERVQQARVTQEELQFDLKCASGLAHAFQDKTRLVAKTADLINSGFLTPSSIYDKGRKEMNEARKQTPTRIPLRRRSEQSQEEEPDA